MDCQPSGRHGHLVILDDSQNRLVLYGGGSRSDLLRSGDDNSEVWELQLGDGLRDSKNFVQSFPWSSYSPNVVGFSHIIIMEEQTWINGY